MSRRNGDDSMNRRRRRNKVYSLDRADGMDREILFVEMSLDEIYERKVLVQQLYAALNQLPPTQARRIYVHYFLQMKKAEIARAEGVSEVAVRISIHIGLENLKNILKITQIRLRFWPKSDLICERTFFRSRTLKITYRHLKHSPCVACKAGKRQTVRPLAFLAAAKIGCGPSDAITHARE